MTPENQKFVDEWNKKSSTLSEVMKRCGISDLRTAKTKARTLKKYLTCTREEKLSARGVAIGEAAPAEKKEVKVAETSAISKEVAEEKKAAETAKTAKLEFRNKRGDVVQTKEISFKNTMELGEIIRQFAAEQSFDKTVIEAPNGSTITPASVKDGDTVVIRPNISGAC
jgi:hypothetical protein